MGCFSCPREAYCTFETRCKEKAGMGKSRRLEGMTGSRGGICVWQTPSILFRDCEKRRRSSGEEGGKGRGGEVMGGGEASAQLFTSGLSSLSCHRSSEIGERRPPNTSFQFHSARDRLRRERMRKIKKVLLQCPEKDRKHYSRI